MSPLALFIASQLRLANDYARDSAVLAGLGSRNAATLLFQAVEAALLAVLTSEGLDKSHRSTQHQLGVMTDMLPDENPLKASFGAVALLTGSRRRTDMPPRAVASAPALRPTSCPNG